MERIPLEPRLPSEANQSKGQSREITTTLQTESTGEGALLVRGGEPEEQQETSAANGSDESDKEGGDWFEIYIEYPSDVPGVAEAKDTEPVEDEDESDEGEEEDLRANNEVMVRMVLEAKRVPTFKGQTRSVLSPEKLMKCRTDPVNMALEVCCALHEFAGQNNAEEGDFVEMENDVRNFALTWLEPLKEDSGLRSHFSGPLYSLVVDKAIETGQKKVIAHPAVFETIERKWYGGYYRYSKSDWTSASWWRWNLVRLRVFFDIILFPVLFIAFGIADAITDRKYGERYMNFFSTPYFVFLRDTVSYLVLLALHFAVCLAPSNVPFSGLEIVIYVFFIGRLTLELHQLLAAGEMSGASAGRNVKSGSLVKDRLALYFRDRWNTLDVITMVDLLVIFVLRLVTSHSSSAVQNRTLAVANYLYGLNAMLLTLRVLGSILESKRKAGVMQIALFRIVGNVKVIFWQFSVAVLAFSMAITKIFMADRSYDSPAVGRENEWLCQGTGVFCWWEIVRHLIWSLLGLADSDKLGSADQTSLILLWLLYALFLIMAVILLVNMLIAVLSNVYQGVEDNALPEWCFKFAVMQQTYRNYHPIPVPLNLVSIPCVALYKLFRRKCCCKTTSQTSDQETGQEVEKEEEREMVDTLNRAYVSIHGHSFPQEKRDETMNKMINLVAQMSSSNADCSAEAWEVEGSCISVEGNTLTCHDVKPWHRNARYRVPLDERCAECEILIQDLRGLFLTFGVTGCSDENSDGIVVGYILMSGEIVGDIYRSSIDGIPRTFAPGDIITCKVIFNVDDGGRGYNTAIRFRHNGMEMETGYFNSSGELYPFIKMGSEGTQVQFTMGRFYQTTPKTPVHEPDEVMKAKLQDFEKMILSGNAETAHITNGMRAQKSQLTETMDKICGLENKMDRWEYKMEKLENKMGGWESNMKGLESKMKGLEAQAEATNEMLQKIMAALNVRDK